MAKANWEALSKQDIGLMAVLARVMADAQFGRPDINGPVLLVTSDYSGSHRGSSYEVYAILVGDLAFCSGWRTARQAVRDHFLADGRRMSYKGLNDRNKRRALRPFLSAANLIPGICTSLLVSKDVSTLFTPNDGEMNPELTDCQLWDRPLFERALRTVHLVSFFVAGLSLPGQDILWFSDEDEIAANPERLTLLTKVWANVLSNYVTHSLRHLRCGTTECDDGSREIEDLAAIPDLAAGALADLLSPLRNQLRLGVITPNRLDSKAKASVIGQWLSECEHPLKRVTLVIDPQPNSTSLTISRIGFQDLSSLRSVSVAGQ